MAASGVLVYFRIDLVHMSAWHDPQECDTSDSEKTVENISDPVDKAIKKIEFHPSILLIKNRIGKYISQNLFCFNEVTREETIEQINDINSKKATPFNTITSKILKISSECSDTLTYLANKSLTRPRKFPSDLKLADITHIYKKTDPQAKENHRSVSFLPEFSKVFEKLIKSGPYITDY